MVTTGMKVARRVPVKAGEYFVISMRGEARWYEAVAQVMADGRLIVHAVEGWPVNHAIPQELLMFDSVHHEDLDEALAASVHHLRKTGVRVDEFGTKREWDLIRVQGILERGKLTDSGRERFAEIAQKRLHALNVAIMGVAKKRRMEIANRRRQKGRAVNPAN